MYLQAFLRAESATSQPSAEMFEKYQILREANDNQ